MNPVIRRFQSAAPVDVSALAVALGINVWESEFLPDGVSGKLFRDPENGGSEGFSIIVRESDAYPRKRFTVPTKSHILFCTALKSGIHWSTTLGIGAIFQRQKRLRPIVGRRIC
jgi:hypothetical protein